MFTPSCRFHNIGLAGICPSAQFIEVVLVVTELFRREMKHPAASSGVSEEHDQNYPKGVTPNVFIGVQFRIRLDSRLKHAGMTVFGKEI
jgi:hypothetical protein